MKASGGKVQVLEASFSVLSWVVILMRATIISGGIGVDKRKSLLANL